MDNFIVQLTAVIALVGGILTLWWRVETRISKGAVQAMEKADEVERNFNDFRLHVADNYVKSGLLKEVEMRILERVGNIVDELHGMRQDFQAALIPQTLRRPARKKVKS